MNTHQKIIPNSKIKRFIGFKSGRKIIIGDQEYRYIIKSGGVRIFIPNGKNIFVDMATFSGWSWDNIERGYWKGYFKITPKDIREWIEKNV